MILFIVVPIFVGAAIVALVLPEETVWSWRRAFVALSWLPIACAAGALGFPAAIKASLGYLLIVILMLTCLSSLLLALVGTRLCSAAKRRDTGHKALVAAVAVASLPLAVVIGYTLLHMLLRSMRG